MSALADFLLARIAEDQQRARDQLIASMFVGHPAGADVPGVDEVERRLRGTTKWQAIDVAAAGRRMGVAVAGALSGVNGLWLRCQAARYADHPDFRPEWHV